MQHLQALKRLVIGTALVVVTVPPPFTQAASPAPSYQFIDLGAAPAGFGYTQAVAMYGSQYAGAGRLTGGAYHAMYWPGVGSTPIDLSPAGYTYSFAYATSSTQQVGEGTASSGAKIHALLWSGCADTLADLNPTGYTTSSARGMDGTRIVGYGTQSGATTSHALLWSGTPATAADINPAGFASSWAQAIHGSQIVGDGSKSYGGQPHALLWNTDTGSATDLHPATGYYSSDAVATDGFQQVGSGNVGPTNHALLWSGTAASYIDLTPAGYNDCTATGVAGGLQVGYGCKPTYPNPYHALLWAGTAASAIDLHQYAPAGCTDSFAQAIDASGTILGVATIGGLYHPVLWVPTPEPATGILLLSMACWATVRRRVYKQSRSLYHQNAI